MSSLNALIRLPLHYSSSTQPRHDASSSSLIRHSLVSTRTHHNQPKQKRGSLLKIHAKGKRGMMDRSKRPPAFSLPKLEDDGNPKFVIFIRMENVYLWYPLSVITGGTTAKIMVAAKDNILGKYIYKGAIDRNLAAVIYKDEKEIQKTAFKQYRVLRSAKEFRYGYKLVENNNLRSALAPNDVIELPTPDKLKSVVDKVKDFFGNAKESFGKLTSLDLGADEPEKNPEEKSVLPEYHDQHAMLETGLKAKTNREGLAEKFKDWQTTSKEMGKTIGALGLTFCELNLRLSAK